ncbi:OSJNBa0042F21.10 protein, related [Eimeria necatrix]|uniref:OSJNBa0042F21.10 protein, related n=1 Tax=Eimeria necatrix TaxID=51315 RepID=U6N5N1_9EIME|nr:OSJNBa0042F21.10 protein, related [Eimeria necatrix]CDJ69225.1 OSJNBa0042F21.10 protein, related [Eimeria necatrix]
MSQSQLLTELAKLLLNGNPKEYTDQFAAVAERGLGVAPDEFAAYYCTGLLTDLHLLVTNNGQLNYQSWEQAATTAARLYEPKQSVLELRGRTSRAIRAAIQANGPRRRQKTENRPGGTHGNCYECQGREHPARVCPSKGERTKRPGETCKKCGGPNAISVSLERGNRLLNTVEGNKMSDEDVQGTQPPSEARLESGPVPMRSEEAPCEKANSSGKSAEATEEDCRPEAIETMPHWWRETSTKESSNQGGALCYVAGSAVPLEFSDEWQGARCCALIGNQPTSSGWGSPFASTALTAAEGEEESPWPMAKLEHTLFEEWINSTEAQAIPCEIIQVLQEYQAVFPDNLPEGLPPKRPHNHHILLAPGKLPAKSAIYRMTPNQLTFHKQEIAKLSDIGWIGPAYSPICSPTIMVDKRDDDSGERKRRTVVNYEALNALTIAPDFPLPPIQTILEILGGAKYFSTLDLEAGLHQIRMAKEDCWKTVFRSVLGLFEYRVMLFGLKEDKIEAIRHWPEVLENDTQICQFLGTINYYRMFMGPDYADVARPLVDLTRKDVSVNWTELHKQAVR